MDWYIRATCIYRWHYGCVPLLLCLTLHRSLHRASMQRKASLDAAGLLYEARSWGPSSWRYCTSALRVRGNWLRSPQITARSVSIVLEPDFLLCRHQ